jgi:hypothetical protein
MDQRSLSNRILLLLVTALLCSCAGTEKFLGSQPSTHLPTGVAIVLDPSIKDDIKVHCLESTSISYTDTTVKGAECLYVSADVSALPSVTLTKETRNAIVGTLVSISDINCSTFLHRAFANRAGLDYTKTLSQDLATAASAGTAFVSAPVSAGMSAANLLIGKSIDSFNATYYQQQTFQAMESAIASARQEGLATINTHEAQDIDTYTATQALADIRQYDDDCSFKNGLAKLNAIATNAQSNATDLKAKVVSAPADQKATVLSQGLHK